jgi:hypothetical protein
MKGYLNGSGGGAALIGAAALLLVVAVLTGRGDMTSATLVLVGVGCFIGGVFILTQYQGTSVPSWIAGLAAADPVIDLTRLCTDLGLQGDAHLFPRDGEIVQIVPVGDLPPTALPSDDYSFISGEYGGGVQLLPPGRLLYDRLVSDYHLVVPRGEEGLCTAIREVGEEVLDIAEKVEAVPDGDLIVVRLSGYRLFDGCTAIRAASPKCCTMIGCPTCSLFACMAVVGLGRPCKIEHVSTDGKERSVSLLLHPLR